MSPVVCLPMAQGRSQFRHTFTGANGTNLHGLPADTGQLGEVLSGTWDINGNTARQTAAVNGVFYAIVWDMGAASLRLSVQITIAAGESAGRLILRATDANNYIFAQINSVADLLTISRYEAGSATTLASLSMTINAGITYTLMALASGTSISASVNGGTVLSTTSSFNQSATKHGVGEAKFPTNTNVSAFDNLVEG